MKKRLLLIGLALIMVFSIVACSDGKKMNEEKKEVIVTETEKAKKTVEQYLEAVKKADKKGVQEYVVKKDKSEEDEISEEDDDELAKILFGKLEYSYKSGEIADKAEEGTLVYSLKLKNISELMEKIFEEGFNHDSIESTLEAIDMDSIADMQTDVSFKLVKEGDKWMLKDTEESMGVLFDE